MKYNRTNPDINRSLIYHWPIDFIGQLCHSTTGFKTTTLLVFCMISTFIVKINTFNDYRRNISSHLVFGTSHHLVKSKENRRPTCILVISIWYHSFSTKFRLRSILPMNWAGCLLKENSPDRWFKPVRATIKIHLKS